MNYNNNLKINYKLNEIEKSYKIFKNSFINDIFFFELDSEEKCNCNGKVGFSSLNYMLSYNDDNLKGLKGQNINVESLFNMKRKIECDKCNRAKKTKILFKSQPKILIISFQLTKKNEEEINKIKFNYNMELNLKKYCLNNKDKDNVNYKLISMMKFLDNKKILKTYCKSSTKKEMWYKYSESKEQQEIEEIILSDEIQTYKRIPYLLIYQKN